MLRDGIGKCRLLEFFHRVFGVRVRRIEEGCPVWRCILVAILCFPLSDGICADLEEIDLNGIESVERGL